MPNIIQNTVSYVRRTLGYDALEPKGRRRAPRGNVRTVENELTKGKRDQLQLTGRDLAVNFAIAAWMIRRHLDYVASFRFQAKTKDKGFNKELEKWMERISRKDYMDAGGRFSREKMFRHFEARRVVDNDVGVFFLNDGRVQSVPQDLIANPGNQFEAERPNEIWVSGVRVNGYGRPIQYSLHKRPKGGSGSEFDKVVNARNFYLYGFFEHATTEQTRGVSPITSALNPLRDVYENFDYALAKAKIGQLFAVAITREAEEEPLEDVFGNPDDNGDESEHTENCPKKTEEKKRVIDLSQGPTVFDLNTGEGVEVVESKTPPMELQAFSKLMIMVSLKALDIPYSFFDESHTNYSGSRGSWLQYDRSAMDKRSDQIELRTRWTLIRMLQDVIDGTLVLPSGMSWEDVLFEWVPIGTPWYDNSKEIKGDLAAIGSALESPIGVTKARGSGDIFRNIDDLAEVVKYAEDKGMEVLGRPLVLNFDANVAPEPQPEQPAQGQQNNGN